jgi:hypothetical protein
VVGCIVLYAGHGFEALLGKLVRSKSDEPTFTIRT